MIVYTSGSQTSLGRDPLANIVADSNNMKFHCTQISFENQRGDMLIYRHPLKSAVTLLFVT